MGQGAPVLPPASWGRFANCPFRDPARRRPIPAEALRFLAESRGFGSIQVLFLNPGEESERLVEDGESAVTLRFNRYFYGPRDYAVVGRKI